ncbi:MAG TPA: zf-HC2 domain-containing protein [Candidatus Acidoferrales bacterium]|nr:zf-HC2 domain-containing protein [Candidatus Acidoferrales bacterium]
MKNDKHPIPACKDYERELVLYYYGECAAEESARVEQHLRVCRACPDFLEDLNRILPLTVETDEPPEIFWQLYALELNEKLAGAKAARLWPRLSASFFRPWPVPAAAALILLLAAGLAFEWRKTDSPPTQAVLLEELPLAENLEFFTAMDMLDALDLIDESGANGAA